MKTLNVGLVLCLNIGVDPPDVIKTSPCAKLLCWIGASSAPSLALSSFESHRIGTTPHFTSPHRHHHPIPHLTSPHRTSLHHTSPHRTSLHHTSPHCTSLHHASPHRTAPHPPHPHHLPYPLLPADPTTSEPAKVIDQIGQRMADQYKKWQPKLKCKQALDPTLDDVKRICCSMRRRAKDEPVRDARTAIDLLYSTLLCCKRGSLHVWKMQRRCFLLLLTLLLLSSLGG